MLIRIDPLTYIIDKTIIEIISLYNFHVIQSIQKKNSTKNKKINIARK